jgi:hypothetical protein
MLAGKFANVGTMILAADANAITLDGTIAKKPNAKS